MKLISALIFSLFTLPFAQASETVAPKDSSAVCGEQAQNAADHDFLKSFKSVADIESVDDLAGLADLESTRDGVSTYTTEFLEDRYHTVYTVKVGQECKILSLSSEGFF